MAESDRGWDGTEPTAEEYSEAAQRLMEMALKSGEGQALRDVKTMMDWASFAGASVVQLADALAALTNKPSDGVASKYKRGAV